MTFVLTSSGSSDGWGKPLGVFTDVQKMKDYVGDYFSDTFSDATVESISSVKDGETYYIRVEGRNKENACVMNFEAFEVGNINKSINNSLF